MLFSLYALCISYCLGRVGNRGKATSFFDPEEVSVSKL